MRYNLFLALAATVSLASLGGLVAQESDYPFRDPLYLSDRDRDLRTPQAVRVGGVVFVSAITGEGETVDEQLRTIYMRIQSLLGNYGLSMAEVAQERIYVRSGYAYAPSEELRIRFYGAKGAPASTVVEVAGLSDEAALVAIELIAVADPEAE